MTKLEKIQEMVNASRVADKENAVAVIYRKKGKRVYKAYELFATGKVDADFCVSSLLGTLI